MSTRCQIAFYEPGAALDNGWTALLYRRCDGYPGEGNTSGVLADLIPTLREGLAKRGFDAEYLAAWTLHDLVAKHIEQSKDSASTPDGRDFMSHGICHQLHADIEFFYAVEAEEDTTHAKITVYERGYRRAYLGVPQGNTKIAEERFVRVKSIIVASTPKPTTQSRRQRHA